MSDSDDNINGVSLESIYLTLPIDKLSKKFFKPIQKNHDLINSALELSRRQINWKAVYDKGQYGFASSQYF